MDKKIFLALLLLSSTIFGTAFATDNASNSLPNPNNNIPKNYEDGLWQISLSGGYTNYQDSLENDGNTVVGRFTIGVKPWRLKKATFGLDAGIQSGNRMRLKLEQKILDQLGGLPIQSTVKPMVDLLATMQLNLADSENAFILLKGGAAYRQWQFDRDSVSSISRIDPEIQAGLGMRISAHTKLVAYYQGIYGGNMNFKINPDGATGQVKDIPSQQGGFLGIEMNI